MNEFLGILAVCALGGLAVATLVAGGFARAGFPLPPDDRRIGCIDGLRGYLALSVLIHHFYLWSSISRFGGSWGRPTYYLLNELGAGAVALFFMTTGLVFYPRVLAGIRATSWLTVYITRVFRIVPLVAVAFLLVTAIVVLRTHARMDAHYIVAALKWITARAEVPVLGYPDSGRINAYVLWSLWYEWLFYLFVLPICAGVMDLVRGRAPTWAVPLGLLVISLLAEIVTKSRGHTILLLQFLPLFAVGMLAFECQKRSTVTVFFRRPIVGFVALAMLAIGMITTEQPYTVSLPLFAIFFISVACGNSLGGLLRLRGALVLGEVSFGIYLLHGILLDILFVDLNPIVSHVPTMALPLILPVAAILIVLITAATYLLIERPAIQTGRRLSRWLAGRRSKLDSRELEVAP